MNDERLQRLWDEIWDLLDGGKSAQAVKAARRTLAETGDEAEIRYLLGLALLDLDEVAAARRELEAVVAATPDWGEAGSALAWADFRACDFAAAGRNVRRALELDDRIPEAHHLQGLLAERSGDDDLALSSFAGARRLDPERYPEPFELEEDEFLQVAQDAVLELDERVRRVLEETAIFVQAFPAVELLVDSDPPLDPQLLGLFVGRSLLEQSVQDSGSLPNTMYLFQRNIERAVTTREELEEEIRITVLHEIAHHFGWDEDEIEARGLG